MKNVKSHTKSKILLALYYLWWLLIIYYRLSTMQHLKPTCDFSPLAIIFISVVWGLVYAIGFLIKSFSAPEPDQTQFLIFVGLTTMPLFIGGYYMF